MRLAAWLVTWLANQLDLHRIRLFTPESKRVAVVIFHACGKYPCLLKGFWPRMTERQMTGLGRFRAVVIG